MLHIQRFFIHFTQSLQPQLSAIKAHDAKLAGQLRRALMAVGLNLGEGYGASGGASGALTGSLEERLPKSRWVS